MPRQARFSFVDPAGKAHSAVLLEAAGSVGAAVLDGKLVALRASGRLAEYKRLDLSFSLRANLLGTKWTLTCGGRDYEEQPPTVRLSPSAIAAMTRGPANDLVDEMEAAIALRRISGFGADGLPILDEARDALEFHERLEEFTPRRFVTPFIVGVNVLIYILMLASSAQGQDLLGWGALYAPRVKEGQLWRLVTAMFVHFGFLHLFFNMLLFVAAARVVERIVGNVGFALLYLISGVLGNVASLQVNPGLMGAGASGAVFGVLGGLLGLMTRYHVYIHLRDIVKVAVLVVLLIVDNAIENHNRPPLLGRIDIAAHIGGFLGGLACGVVLCQRIGPSVPAGRRVRNSILAGGGLIVGLAGALLAPRVDDLLVELRLFVEAGTRLERDVPLYVLRIGQRGRDSRELAETLRNNVIPEWGRTCERLGALSRVPSLYRDLVAALREYGRVRSESWAVLLDAAEENDAGRLGKFREKWAEADSVLQHFMLTQLEGRKRS
jgi:membrane associated rhomboid family serine protease